MKILLLVLLIPQLLFSKDFYLLISIGSYENQSIASLEKSGTDVNNYHKILKHWKVTLNKKYELINKKASKKNILKKLAYIAKKIKHKDRFFMFFSGHGTNLFDENYTEILQKAKLTKLMRNSGAILAYDFNPKKLSETLIIGRRDLKPYLKEIDNKGVNTLVIFDACFAENSIKGTRRRVNRTPNILTQNRSYPYKNIVYIASSILQSQSGKFSPIIRSCLLKYCLLNDLKSCINQQISRSMQIPVVLANNQKISLFK